MKTFLILGLGGAMALAQSAPQKNPINRESLGQTEGILGFCAKIDPQSAAKYREGANLLTRDESDKDVETARKSKEYHEAFDSTSAQFDKVPASDEAVKSCKAFLGEK
jgi:hypothetical protein